MHRSRPRRTISIAATVTVALAAIVARSEPQASAGEPPCIPDAVDDTYLVNVAGETLAGNVTENDITCNLPVDTITSPTHGSGDGGADGSFTYTPDPGFAGTDSFTYRLGDETSTEIATVTIDVVLVATTSTTTSSTTTTTATTVVSTTTTAPSTTTEPPPPTPTTSAPGEPTTVAPGPPPTPPASGTGPAGVLPATR